MDHGAILAQAFAANPRFHRTRKKPSQAVLAQLAHLRLGTISELDLAKSNLRTSTVESLALALRIDPMFLVGRPAKKGDS